MTYRKQTLASYNLDETGKKGPSLWIYLQFFSESQPSFLSFSSLCIFGTKEQDLISAN